MRASVVIRVRDEAAALERLLGRLARADRRRTRSSWSTTPRATAAAGVAAPPGRASSRIAAEDFTLRAGAQPRRRARVRRRRWSSRCRRTPSRATTAGSSGWPPRSTTRASPAPSARARLGGPAPCARRSARTPRCCAPDPEWGYSNGAGAFRAALWRERAVPRGPARHARTASGRCGRSRTRGLRLPARPGAGRRARPLPRRAARVLRPRTSARRAATRRSSDLPPYGARDSPRGVVVRPGLAPLAGTGATRSAARGAPGRQVGGPAAAEVRGSTRSSGATLPPTPSRGAWAWRRGAAARRAARGRPLAGPRLRRRALSSALAPGGIGVDVAEAALDRARATRPGATSGASRTTGRCRSATARSTSSGAARCSSTSPTPLGLAAGVPPRAAPRAAGCWSPRPRTRPAPRGHRRRALRRALRPAWASTCASSPARSLRALLQARRLRGRALRTRHAHAVARATRRP